MRIDVPEYGTFVDFPDGIDPAQISAAMAQNFPPKTPAPAAAPENGYMARLGKNFDTRIGKSEAIRNDPNMTEIEKRIGYAGQGLGMGADVVNEGLSSAYKMLPDSVQRGLAKAGNAILESRPILDSRSIDDKTPVPSIRERIGAGVKEYGEFSKENPRTANIANAAGNAANLAGGLTIVQPAAQLVKAGIPVAKEAALIGVDAARLLGSKSAATLTKKIDKTIQEGIEKAVRPTVVGKRTASQMKSYAERAKAAVNTIIGNKENLSLLDVNGNAVKGLPQSLKQFSEAIEQTKRSVYQQYHDMATGAGEAGSVFDSSKILTKLDDVSVDLKHNPEVRKYAESLKSEIGELHGQAPDVIEARIADLNSSLSGFYEGRVSRAKAQVDASVANLMREELDNKIMTAVGPGYQGLKNTYGSLKTLEKEVAHRAVVDARKNIKGLVDMTDIFTKGEIVTGILTANPALIARGTAGLGIKAWIKSVNNPDNIVKGMFGDVEKLTGKLATAKAPATLYSRTGQAIREGMQPTTLEAYLSPGDARLPVTPFAGGPQPSSADLAVGPVRSGATLGEPYGPPPATLIQRKQLPPGQGFEMRDSDIIDVPYTSRTIPVPRLESPQPGAPLGITLRRDAGEGFSMREGVPLPDLLRKDGKPFMNEAGVLQAIKKEGAVGYEPVKVDGGWIARPTQPQGREFRPENSPPMRETDRLRAQFDAEQAAKRNGTFVQSESPMAPATLTQGNKTTSGTGNMPPPAPVVQPGATSGGKQVVYHAGPEGLSEIKTPAYFSSKPEYVEGHSNAGQVYPVDLSIKKPWTIGNEALTQADLNKAGINYRLTNEIGIDQIGYEPELVKAIKEAGYDVVQTVEDGSRYIPQTLVLDSKPISLKSPSPLPEVGKATLVQGPANKGPQNLVTYLQKNGFVRLGEYADKTGDVWDRAHGYRSKDRSREMGDIAAVSRQNGALSMDEAATNLNSEGWGPQAPNGREWTPNDLFNVLSEKGRGRNVFTPDKSDAIIQRKMRGPEHDYIQNHPEYIAAQETDAGAISETVASHKAGLYNEIRAEGFDIPNQEAALKEIGDFLDEVTGKKITDEPAPSRPKIGPAILERR